MKVEIEVLDNGLIVRSGSEGEPEFTVHEFKNYDEDICLDALESALYQVINGLGYFGSKHDARRLSIEVKCQDKQ